MAIQTHKYLVVDGVANEIIEREITLDIDSITLLKQMAVIWACDAAEIDGSQMFESVQITICTNDNVGAVMVHQDRAHFYATVFGKDRTEMVNLATKLLDTINNYEGDEVSFILDDAVSSLTEDVEEE